VLDLNNFDNIPHQNNIAKIYWKGAYLILKSLLMLPYPLIATSKAKNTIAINGNFEFENISILKKITSIAIKIIIKIAAAAGYARK
jgi:hypothetical protein